MVVRGRVGLGTTGLVNHRMMDRNKVRHVITREIKRNLMRRVGDEVHIRVLNLD